jgi:hypothetical protein
MTVSAVGEQFKENLSTSKHTQSKAVFFVATVTLTTKMPFEFCEPAVCYSPAP